MGPVVIDDNDKVVVNGPMVQHEHTVLASEPGTQKPNGGPPIRVLSFDEICQTVGFVNNQQQAPGSARGERVRFVVQPVVEDVIPSINIVSSSLPVESNFFGDGISHDELGTYGYTGLSDPQAQLTVRSMASIGLGSSNGRKIHLRRVHTTGAESLVAPLIAGSSAAQLHQQQTNGETVHSHWPFPSLNIKVNGKTLDGKATGTVESSSSSSDEDGSSSSSSSSSGGTRKKKQKRRRRGHGAKPGGQVWGSRLEFLLACVGLAAGLGNIWRFPYMAYKSGGGAFLIPYCITVFLCGIPLQILELAVGQYTREGPFEAMRSICPLFSGVGIGMVMLSLMLSSYYSVAMAWAGLYLGFSFTPQLPWTHCNNSWNTAACRLPVNISPISVSSAMTLADDNRGMNKSDGLPDEIHPSPLPVSAAVTNWTTPGQEFFDRRIVQMSDGVDVLGDLQWELAVCLIIAWALLFITLRKSVRWSGKAVYVTATLPYVLLLALTARALTLDGADDGLRFFFHPDWSLLLKADVWVNALAQTFMSMGIAYGCLTAFASYNRFRSPFVRDALCLSALNSVISLIVGIIVFAALGHTAYLYDAPLHNLVTDGLSFSLVMYSTVVSSMPFPQFWAVFLFVMFICLGLDTQFATVEVVRLTVQRFVKQCCGTGHRQPGKSSSQSAQTDGGSRCVPDLVAVSMCLVCFIGSIPYVTQGGIYLMHLTDYYVGTVAIIVLALTLVVSTGMLYGAGRLSRNIREMTAHSPSPLLVACWAFFTPVLILAILIFDLVEVSGLVYGNYIFPVWAIAVGWTVLALVLVAIPILAVVAVCQACGKTIIRKLINATKSQMSECPCCRRGVRGLRYTHSAPHINEDVNGMGGNTAYAFAEFAEITYPEDGTVTITSASSLPATLLARAVPVIQVSSSNPTTVNSPDQPRPD